MDKKELIAWLIEHAPLLSMCESGGWPDLENMNIQTCQKSASEWLIIVDFNEHIREISVCEPSIHNRCAHFSIALDPHGKPVSIRLISRM